MAKSKESSFAGTERFVVRRKLGSGAMGVVYEAFDRERGEAVALKTLRRPDPALLYRLKKEFRALAELAHPQLVALRELISHEDRWFFTMELVWGVSFLEWVRPGAAGGRQSTQRMSSTAPAGRTRPIVAANSKLDLARLRGVLPQLAEGVAALHRARKLHRDLKPSNVLVTPEGRVKICDFGLVTDAAAHEQTRSRHALGTPLYMSPEQAANQPLTEASDWYSVGVMLYVALAGCAPFRGTPYVIMRDKQLFEPPPPGAVAAGVPIDLDALCVRLLARAPHARPEGREVLERLGVTTGSAAPSVGENIAPLEEAMVASRRDACAMITAAPVRAFLARVAEDEEATVLVSRCRERESVPYQALDGLIDGLSRRLRTWPADELPAGTAALAKMFPVLRRVEAIAQLDETAGSAIAAFRGLLDQLARCGPLVLCIEDVQFGDPDSARVLASVLAPPAPRLLLILTAPQATRWLDLPIPLLS